VTQTNYKHYVRTATTPYNMTTKTPKYDIFRPWLTLDPWQTKYINTEGNCFLLCGRQSGKTAAASIKFGKRAATKPNSIILMIAYTEKQAYSLFFKTLMYLEAKYPNKIIRKGNKGPTKHIINLTNGSIIKCYAAGVSGDGLRGETITDLVIDEAAPMDRDIFTAVTPMISITGGTIDILSTPRGKEGYFYDCSLRDDYTKFYVSAEDCPRHTKEYLASERATMSELQYAQEYLAMFLDELKRVYSDQWIKKVCNITLNNQLNTNTLLSDSKPQLPPPIEVDPTQNFLITSPLPARDYFLGMDIARMGKDETTFECLDGTNPDNVTQVFRIVTKRQLITETARKAIRLNELWDFNKIGIDDGGMGVGVLDILLGDSSTENKVVGLNNASRDIDAEEGHKPLLKEDMYNYTLIGGEQGKLHLLNNDELIASFKSIQWEFTNGKVRISGNDSHEVEGVIRGYYLIKQKLLKPFIMSL